jgi:hypothetical protein
MIIKYKLFKESLLNKIEGPSKEDVWKNLGYEKGFDTPEEFFLDVIDGIKVKKQTKYPNSVFWEKEGKIVFEQDLKNMDLWVSYNMIWVIFEKVFGMEYNEIESFIKGMVEEYLNWKGFTPPLRSHVLHLLVEEYLNWKGFTPYSCR